jgi:hypothetical protein
MSVNILINFHNMNKTRGLNKKSIKVSGRFLSPTLLIEIYYLYIKFVHSHRHRGNFIKIKNGGVRTS